MIGRLAGLLLEKNPPRIVVDVHGVGYELDVPMSTFYQLPATGASVQLFTHFLVREDGQFLYGFFTQDERLAFEQLLKVSGIGARTALSVLSGLSVHELGQCIVQQDSARLVKVPGIGQKTAERLLLELKDRFNRVLPKMAGGVVGHSTGAVVEPSAYSDILNALLSLGYNEKEAKAAMRTLPEDTGVSEGIRLALKSLSKV